MRKWVVGFMLAGVAGGQVPGEIPAAEPSAVKHNIVSSQSHPSPDEGSTLVDGKIQELIGRGAQTLPVFIVLRLQPHREMLERYEGGPARLRVQVLEGRYEQLSRQIVVFEADLSLARNELEREMLEVRQSAFREIEAQIGPDQEEVAKLISHLGGLHIQRYTAINMLSAEVPASAIDGLAAHPSVAEISLVEKQSAQLAVSALSLGAPIFWSAGYTGSGELVAVMDTGVRTSHPAFSGLNIASRVFLDNGRRTDPCFGDDATSAEDKQGHGTHVAGIVASRGAAGWSTYWGVARGLGTLYNLKIGYFNKCTGRGTANTADVLDALDWAVRQAPWVRIYNYSYGSDVSADDDALTRLFDYFTDTYGLTISVAAGNESESGFLGLWTNPGPVSSPGICYNVITVAAMNTQGTVDRNDDDIAIFSSRGPTVSGRRKPDLAAPGGLRDELRLSGWQPVFGVYSADHQSGNFVPKPGTSMAAPHIAGAVALLRQAGVREPLAIKALLLNTTDWLFWRNDRGWGYANLARAFGQRSNALTSTLASSRVRLYRGLARGLFYSSLTWNRSVNQTWTGGCLADLDLFLYDGSSGTRISSSTSSIDNVEKASATLSGPLVVNVTHWAQPSCRSPETFGLAFLEAGFQAATGPVVSVSCTAPSTVVAGAQFNVACTIANRGDLPAVSVQGTLGFAGSASTSPQEFGTIASGGSSAKTWVVTAPASVGTFTLQLAARSESFGGIFSGSANITVSTTSGVCTYTVTPASVNVPALGGSGTLNVTAPAGCSWQAVSNAAWIVVTSGAQGAGSGTVTFSVAANTSPMSRTGSITVAGQGFSVVQAAATIGPVIASVVNGASFQPGIAAGARISIFGSNLASTTRTWRDDEIVTGILPTQLDGVRVVINGRATAVHYISPAQLNVQAPTDDTVGLVQIQATTPQGTTTAQMQAFAPGLFSYDHRNRRYVAAQHARDYGLVGELGSYPGATPVSPGEIVILYGTGFGPTNPPVPAGRLITQPTLLANPVRVRIGGLPAEVLWAGLVIVYRPSADTTGFEGAGWIKAKGKTYHIPKWTGLPKRGLLEAG